MKADIDDIPPHIHLKRKGGPWRFLAILGVGTTIFLFVAITFDEQIDINLNTLKNSIRIAGNPLFESDTSIPDEIPQRPATLKEERIATKEPNALPADQSGYQSPPQEASKQTSFNDQNYQPRGAINTIPAPNPATYENNNRPRQVQHKPMKQMGSWTWTGADRKKVKINIEWLTVNGWIEYHTVCQNKRRGSLEYRDCRKAAKEYFVHRCRTDKHKAFCHAENNYNPL